MKKALVCGAGGFIGHHLVNYLKQQGYWVRAADLKYPEFCETQADEFCILDLRKPINCKKALLIQDLNAPEFDEVFQLAADMGGMGFIHSAECEIMHNSSLINLHMIHECALKGIKNYFFSSSACVYRDMEADEEFVDEDLAYPAMPDNEYGWEKLYAERICLSYGRRYNMNIRIARFQNCFGPYGTWKGGREKAPAALCRKIAAAKDGGIIEVWGDGSALRSYTYISDLVSGIFMLMHSNLQEPVNIGLDQFVSVNELVETIAKVAGKKISIRHIEGPVGVKSRNHLFEKINSIGWKAEVSLKAGIQQLYPWIKEQVERTNFKEEKPSEQEKFFLEQEAIK